MSKTKSESPDTLTSGSRHTPSGKGGRSLNQASQRRRSDRILSPGQVNKFDRAFSKSVKVRSRVLGRRLTREEFKSLVKAVRKQLKPAIIDPASRLINDLHRRLLVVENATPRDRQALTDALAVARTQVDLLRTELMSLVDDQQGVKEICPHVDKKSKVYLSITDNFEVNKSLQGLYVMKSTNTEQHVCCKACLSLRQDAFFSWFGEEWVAFTPEQRGCLSASNKRDLSLDPLSIQSIWMAVLDYRYSRRL
jgi:hypothetical protein